MVVKGKKSKYLFTLCGLDTEKIEERYGITPNNEEGSEEIYQNVTSISDLGTDKGTPKMIPFLDEAKKSRSCFVSMIDHVSGMSVNFMRYNCFWCRHPFSSRPIGCPIRYIPRKLEKKYHSCISKDTYTIKENLSDNKVIKPIDTSIFTEYEGEVFETDGAFCSFNCCKAWINDNKHNPMYNESDFLLTKMYNSIMGTKSVTINSAPSWRLLEQYGGHKNIVSFREGFTKVEYEYHGTYKFWKKFLPIGQLYEEKIKL